MTPFLVGCILLALSGIAAVAAVYLFYRAFTVPHLPTSARKPREQEAIEAVLAGLEQMRGKLEGASKPSPQYLPDALPSPTTLVKMQGRPLDSLAHAYKVSQSASYLQQRRIAIVFAGPESHKSLSLNVDELFENINAAAERATIANSDLHAQDIPADEGDEIATLTKENYWRTGDTGR